MADDTRSLQLSIVQRPTENDTDYFHSSSLIQFADRYCGPICKVCYSGANVGVLNCMYNRCSCHDNL